MSVPTSGSEHYVKVIRDKERAVQKDLEIREPIEAQGHREAQKKYGWLCSDPTNVPMHIKFT